MADDKQSEVEPRSADDDDLLEAPERGSATELMDHGAAGELGPMRHSAAHVLAEAVLDLFPGTKLGIGPVIEDGFYYDFLLPRPLTPDDLPTHRGAHARIDRGRPPVRAQRGDARGGARPGSPSRGRTSRSRSSMTCSRRRSATATPMPPTTFYRQGPFIDLCRGPHVASTGKIGPFKLLGTAGAYWRGDEKRPMLQRVYGTAWATQEDLDAYLWRREEAKKRDHRRLGVALDLFSFHDVSPGAAFWHPKGQHDLAHARRRDARAPGAARLPGGVDADRRVRAAVARSPATGTCIADNMFLVESENQTFSLKPMNCPESTYIYRSHLRSYRDLPLRFSEFGRLHRNERSGTLSGLDARPPVHPGRCAPLRPARPAHRRDRRAARRGPGVVRLVRARAAVHVRDEARQGDRRSGAVGTGGAADPGGVRRRRHQLRAEAEGRHVLRAQDRHLHRRRARPRVADGDDPDRPDDAARAVRPDLHRRGGQAPAADRHPPSHLRLAGAVHRDPHRAFRGGVPAVARAGPGGRDPDRGSAHRGGARSWRACCGRAGCASRSTPRRTGCSTRSGPPRSRRCRTWSCWATARSRRGRRRRGPEGGEQQPAEHWESFADRLAEESRARVDRVDAVALRPGVDRRLAWRRCRDQGRDRRLLAWAVLNPDLPQFTGKAFTGRAVVYPIALLVLPVGWWLVGPAAWRRLPGRRSTSCSACRS